MKILSIALSLCLLIVYGLAHAGQEIVVVQSLRIKPYSEALNGVKEICQARIHHFIIEEIKDSNLIEDIKNVNPAVILAIGPKALVELMPIEDIPIIYLMVLNPETIVSIENNIRGVSMNIPPDKQLSALLDALPGIKNIGILYDPNHSSKSVELARISANKMGINIIAQAIHHSKEVPTALMKMKDSIDVFWMLPDLTVVTPESVEFLLLFSFENKLPIMTFSEKYVNMGAFISMNIEAFDMGKQAGEMANKVITGSSVNKIERSYARKATVSTNMLIASKFGLLNIAVLDNSSYNKNKIRKTTHLLN